MDSQLSNFWILQNDGKENAADKCKQDAIAMSLDSSIPCAFTRAVAYRTTDSEDDSSRDNEKRKKKGDFSPAFDIVVVFI